MLGSIIYHTTSKAVLCPYENWPRFDTMFTQPALTSLMNEVVSIDLTRLVIRHASDKKS